MSYENAMKYSPELTAEIATYVREGNTKQDACLLADISRDCFYKWMDDKSEFAAAIIKAESECKARNIKLIQKAAITTWQAAAWWLERRYRDEYALTNKLESNIADLLSKLVEKYACK